MFKTEFQSTSIVFLVAPPAAAFSEKTLICDAEERLANFETGEIFLTNLQSHSVKFLGNKASVTIRGAKTASEWQEIWIKISKNTYVFCFLNNTAHNI